MSGLWSTALGWGENELADVAAEQMRKLAFGHLFAGKSHEPAIALAEKLKEISPFPGRQGVLRQFRLGSQRHPDQASPGTPPTRAARPRRKDHLPHQGLSRRDAGERLAHRPRQQPQELRPAVRLRQIRRLPALLSRRRGGRERAAIFRPPGRQPGRADPARRPRHHRRHDRRAGDGRGRRRSCRRTAISTPSRRCWQIRHSADRRRGDHRLRPHRQLVRLRHLRLRARKHVHRQGAVERLSADLGGAAVAGTHRHHRAGVRQDRHLRPRLHLYRPSRSPPRWRSRPSRSTSAATWSAMSATSRRCSRSA